LETASALPNRAMQREASTETSSDLRGAGRLIIDAVAGVTGIVESMHRNISGMAPIVGPPRQAGTKGITGLVYRSVRGVSRLVGFGLDATLAQLAPLLKSRATSPRREAVLAALNGVLGDYLVASNNPLAISMRLRKDARPLTLDRQALAADFPRPGTKLVVLVHGLCVNDLQWRRKGHDHGASLARDLGYTPLYLHYNSGLHISTNGRQFADLLEQLVQEWPVAVRELVVIGHSMGGLLSRSACHYARLAGHAWPHRLKKLVFLGTPHHGAPLERAGNWVDILVGISPYTAPFGRLGTIRSAGVKDLRYGNVVDADWESGDSEQAHDPRKRVPLPRSVQCFAIAATRQLQSGRTTARLRGDGLVPVKSALGQHENAALTLRIPASRRSICYGLSHLDLQSSGEVYDRIHRWLSDE
jgi:pimeloyl-ACP methyl ester carboxylesterase